jgi:catalase-peroxidase
MIPDAHDASKKHPPMMTTADMSLRMDPTARYLGALVPKKVLIWQDPIAEANHPRWMKKVLPQSRQKS